MTNKFKLPRTLIFIFLLNVSSLYACGAADDAARLASKNADDAARLASKNADDVARLGSKTDDAARLSSQAAARQIQEWAGPKVEREISEAMRNYGGIPENFVPEAQERITQEIINDANSKGIKLSVNMVYASVGGILTDAVNRLPARATTPTPNEEVR